MVRTLLFAWDSSYLGQRKREGLLDGILGKAISIHTILFLKWKRWYITDPGL